MEPQLAEPRETPPTEIERRALARIQDDIAHKRYKAVAIAARTGFVPSTISNVLKGKRALSFQIIEAAAQLKGVDAAEFVADPRSELRVLDPLEAEVLRYLRSWPKHVQQILADFLQYFGSVLEAERQIRDVVAYFRKLSYKEKQDALGNLALRSEGRLPGVAPTLTPSLPGGSIDAQLLGLPPVAIERVRRLVGEVVAAQRPKRARRG